jgi:glycerophosphoryl diester phosphodiesterase
LPGVRLILSPPAEALRDEEALRRFVSQYRPEVVDQAPSREFVGWCRDLGVRVWVDIQRPDERPGYWERFLGLGVDGVQTDHPAGLKAWLGTVPGRWVDPAGGMVAGTEGEFRSRISRRFGS